MHSSYSCSKRNCFRWMVLPLFLSVYSALKAQDTPTADWTPYIDSVCSLEYPSTWRMDNSGFRGAHFLLYAPADDANDNFAENITLIISDLSAFPGVTLDEITEASVAQTRQMIPGIEFTERKFIVRDGLRYHVGEYKGVNQGEQMHTLQYSTLLQERLFLLTFSATEKQYGRYWSDVQRIFSSFIPH